MTKVWAGFSESNSQWWNHLVRNNWQLWPPQLWRGKVSAGYRPWKEFLGLQETTATEARSLNHEMHRVSSTLPHNSGFKNANLFQCDWYISGQSEQNWIWCFLMHGFIQEKYRVKRENCIAEPWWQRIHEIHTSQISTSYLTSLCAMSQVHPHLLLQLSFQFHIIFFQPLYDNSYSTAFQYPLLQLNFRSSSRWSTIFTVICMCIFFNHNMYKTAQKFLFGSHMCVCMWVCVCLCHWQIQGSAPIPFLC